MKLSELDWGCLNRLREKFLTGSAGAADYWTSPDELEAYDQTFAQRIGWKWEYVLDELSRLSWTPPGGEALDWGCGTGVAGRCFLRHFPSSAGAAMNLLDRSTAAVEFARQRLGREFPALHVRRLQAGQATDAATLLISHVLGELSVNQQEQLAAQILKAQAVIWLEPGTHELGRLLMQFRRRMVGQFHVVAPCTHQGQCRLLESGNARHWCHHFATSPPDIYADGDWVRFGKLAGIDLRSLPVSYLVLDRRPPPAMPDGACRVIGRPRVYKPDALFFCCDAAGAGQRRFTKRLHPELHRAARKGRFDSLQVMGQ